MLKGIDPDRALQLVLAQTPDGTDQELPVADAVGRVLAETVEADRDYPPFARATMDGFAVRVGDAGRKVRVLGEVAAGADPDQDVLDGTAVAIMTGAPCPAGTEAVVPVEQVRVRAEDLHLPDGLRVGQNIVPRGSEREVGAPVAGVGTRVSPLTLAALVSVGRERVRARVPPVVAVVSTGNEVVDPGTQPGPSQIRNSNGPMLAAAARRLGVERVVQLHAEDSLSSLHHALDAAVADIVLLSGGVSAGRYDLVPRALEEIGVRLVFHKVKQLPGRPLLFGHAGERLYFGLPGNPIASHFCFHRYVAAAIRRMAGWPAPGLARGRLAVPLTVSCRHTLFVPARVAGQEPDGWQVEPVLAGSGNVFACADTRAYLRLDPGRHELSPGTDVMLDWM